MAEIKLDMTKKELITLVGLLGATEGVILNDVYKQLTKQMDVHDIEYADEVTASLVDNIQMYINEDIPYENVFEDFLSEYV